VDSSTSVPQIPARRTSTTTCPAPGTGSSTSQTRADPGPVITNARTRTGSHHPDQVAEDHDGGEGRHGRFEDRTSHIDGYALLPGNQPCTRHVAIYDRKYQVRRQSRCRQAVSGNANRHQRDPSREHTAPEGRPHRPRAIQTRWSAQYPVRRMLELMRFGVTGWAAEAGRRARERIPETRAVHGRELRLAVEGAAAVVGRGVTGKAEVDARRS
jgi:hypothetical protein